MDGRVTNENDRGNDMGDWSREETPGVVVPINSLKEDVLRQVVADVLLREEGNDVSTDLSEGRVENVIKQLRKGTHVLTYDQETETVGIADAKDFPKMN